MGSSVKPVVAFFLMAAVCVAVSNGAVYRVGDSAGWSNIGHVDYKAWSASKNFSVGDTVVFEYNSEFHNVLRVNHKNYKACNGASPYETFSSGIDTFAIRKTGHFYFICSRPGHCEAGQKVDIRVSGSAVGPSPSQPPKPKPVPSPPTVPSSPPHSDPAPVPSPPTTPTTIPSPSPSVPAPVPSPPTTPITIPSPAPSVPAPVSSPPSAHIPTHPAPVSSPPVQSPPTIPSPAPRAASPPPSPSVIPSPSPPAPVPARTPAPSLSPSPSPVSKDVPATSGGTRSSSQHSPKGFTLFGLFAMLLAFHAY